MKIKVITTLIILSSLFVYLEWGKDNHSFLFQAEYEVLYKLISDPVAALHPLTLIPLLGQILLLISVFKHEPGKWMIITGVISLGILLGFILVIGSMVPNVKMILSTIPFMLFVTWLWKDLRQIKKTEPNV